MNLCSKLFPPICKLKKENNCSQREENKAPGPNGFPLAFLQTFLEKIKVDVVAFMTEFHEKGKLSKHIGASLIALIAKADAENV